MPAILYPPQLPGLDGEGYFTNLRRTYRDRGVRLSIVEGINACEYARRIKAEFCSLFCRIVHNQRKRRKPSARGADLPIPFSPVNDARRILSRQHGSGRKMRVVKRYIAGWHPVAFSLYVNISSNDMPDPKDLSGIVNRVSVLLTLLTARDPL